MLIRRSERPARRSSLVAALQGAVFREFGSAQLPAADRGWSPAGLPRSACCRLGMCARRRPARRRLRVRRSPSARTSARFVRSAARSRRRSSNDVWVGQEPAWDSPINRGSHCAKGAAAREVVHGDRRLKYPMKLLNGHWIRVSWETAIDEIGDKARCHPRKVRTRLGLLAGLRQILQRRSLSLPEARGVLGHQQRRSLRAHLPFHDRRRPRQYLGLRRDDQQLQRHPQLQDDAHFGRQSRPKRTRCRCSTCSKAKSSTVRTSLSSIRA